MQNYNMYSSNKFDEWFLLLEKNKKHLFISFQPEDIKKSQAWYKALKMQQLLGKHFILK